VNPRSKSEISSWEKEELVNFLTRDTVLKAKDLLSEKVEVPEWGGQVCVRCMTGTERDAFESEAYSFRGKDLQVNRENFRARLLVRTLADDKGERLFADSDLAALGGKSGKVLDRLFTIAMRINGLSREDVEELTKNSAPGRRDSSTLL